ncbi:Hypp8137 [Branchiostoma lanceolatum]|uniref:Hypp8137 protein n=1 Tax=Branchiostoma lanceolatum TaxID=7740 RepID=A0A8K0EHB4_BRALA|nr:Hypp8137 [Branchiostoma lanceolatum]
MHDKRIPKILLYGELAEGKRPSGRPKLRYKDNLKATLKSSVFQWKAGKTPHPTDCSGAELFIRVTVSLRPWLPASRRRGRRGKKTLHSHNPTYSSTCGRCFRARIGLISHSRTHKDD